MRTIGNFKWEKGNINDNIRNILINEGISYRNTLNGDVEVDLFGINYWEKVRYTLTNLDNEIYAVNLD